MIRFGHNWSEIQNYSYAQIKIFLEGALEVEAEERRNRLVETAIASQGDSKAINEAVRKLG